MKKILSLGLLLFTLLLFAACDTETADVEELPIEELCVATEVEEPELQRVLPRRNVPPPVLEPQPEIAEEDIRTRTSRASRWHFEEFDDLVELSHVIILGEVLDIYAKWSDFTPLSYAATMSAEDRYIIYTFNRVRVLEVFSGDAVEPGDVIEMAQVGGQVGADRHIASKFYEIEPGQTLVLFLRNALLDEVVQLDWPEDVPFTLTDRWHGAHRMPDVPMSDMASIRTLPLDIIHPEAPGAGGYVHIPITLMDVAQITYTNFGIDAVANLSFVDPNELHLWIPDPEQYRYPTFTVYAFHGAPMKQCFGRQVCA